MKRPYIICHMLQSIDGSISGDFFLDERTKEMSLLYKNIGNEFNVDAEIYGSVTAEELFTKGNHRKIYSDLQSNIKKEDFIHTNDDNKKWIVIFDPFGSLNWTERSLKNPRLLNKNILVVLLKSISIGYLEYLKDLNISYIFGGNKSINLTMVLEKLHAECNIKRLVIKGGGVLNGSFAIEDLIDEISLLIAPTLSLSVDLPRCFEDSFYSKQKSLIKYRLKNVKKIKNSGIWLNYAKI